MNATNWRFQAKVKLAQILAVNNKVIHFFIINKNGITVNLSQPTFTCSKLTINNRNNRTKVRNMFKINNKWRRFAGFIVNLEHISHICSNVSIVNFEQVIAGWD